MCRVWGNTVQRNIIVDTEYLLDKNYSILHYFAAEQVIFL